MGQTIDKIESHIENKREDLKSNLQELETRVRTATDWRHYFEVHTGTMIAAAFGGGVLLAAMIGRRGSSRTSQSQRAGGFSERTHSRTRSTHQEIEENLDSIKSALVGAAATKFKSILGEVVPGFTEHLAKAEGDRGRESTH